MQYKNPDPVVVGLVFNAKGEILTVRRSIEPHIGEMALPGGYVGRGEDWRSALQREIQEEACVLVSTEPEHMKIFDVHSTPDGEKILIFAVIKSGGIKEISDFQVNSEASERIFYPVHYYSIPQLCFPLHYQVVERYRKENFTHADAHVGGW